MKPDAGEETLARIVRDVGVELGADRCTGPRRRRSPVRARARGEPLDVVDDALAGDCNPALERVLGHRAFMHGSRG